MPVAGVLSPAGGINITGLTAAAVATADQIPFFDDSVNANRKITYGDLRTAVVAGVVADVDVVEIDVAALQLEVAALTASAATSLRGYIDGCTLSNDVSDASNDIVISPGVARSSGNTATLVLTGALIKRSDATWTAGTGNGGMDTGVKPVSGTLHTYLISDGATADVIFSIAAGGPLLPAGYTTFRRIGAVLTDASSNIRGFFQNGDVFSLRTRAHDRNNTTVTSTATLQVLSVPTGILVAARFQLRAANGFGDQYFFATSPSEADQLPNATGIGQGDIVTAATFNQFNELVRTTNTSGQIRLRGNISGLVSIITSGWIDTRGKDA